MWKAKLKKNEHKIAALLTIAVGILHFSSYIIKTEKCNICGSFVDSWVVGLFHKTNYALWFLLFYTVLINKKDKCMKIVYLFGCAISEYLFCNEFFGNPNNWGGIVVAGFILVLALTLYRYKRHFLMKNKYI